MPDQVKPLPSRPNLEQYRKQAKELARACGLRTPEALTRVQLHHPRFARLGPDDMQSVTLTDAQFVIAREHGFESWPKFAAHITTLNLQRSVASLPDPVAAFIRAACAPREAHASGTLEEAELILAQYPQVRRANIYVAAMLADEAGVRDFLARDTANATAKGGPDGWDALTHLCFSRYLRVDRSRSDAFVNTARALLDAGASANTGWIEMIDYPNPRPVIESAIYGAAGVAQHEGLTRLLLERGADPNDEETPYHVAENYDLAVLKVLLDSDRLNSASMTTLLLRKGDWHDTEGIRMLLEHGADPNAMTRWGYTALHQALHRDNRLVNIELFVDHGADPTLKNIHTGRSGISMAARRGRGDVLRLLEERGFDLALTGVEALIAACAKADDDAIRAIISADPEFVEQLVAEGGTVLAEFAGNGNSEGVRALLNVGIPPDALYAGDGYFDIAPNSTALHVAAWHAWPDTVKLLIERGSPVNTVDGKGRTPLALAVKACVDSYWKNRRTPESVEALLSAGATIEGIEIPCGYDEVDELLSKAKNSGGPPGR